MTDDGWRRLNDQFRETEWERNDRLRRKRLERQRAEKDVPKSDATAPPVGTPE